MKIDYRETTSDLLKRIDIHNKFGSKDIDQWMLATLDIQKGSKILDVGCGAGKQCFSYYNFLKGDCDITGGDVSTELLSQAIEENKKFNNPVKFVELNFNKPFNFPSNQFDLLSCCFAIYYSENIPFTIQEMHRVIKSGGRLFTTGPMPDNKKVFYDIIREATGKPIPPMPGSSRFGSEILNTVKSLFSDVKVELFENPLVFNSAEPFVEYTRASLSEDRRLWTSLFDNKSGFEQVMEQINNVAVQRIASEKQIVMTKVVGGILATK
jgi:ubiquinone/menaquinone biosynthesis C-methylase UbiE